MWKAVVAFVVVTDGNIYCFWNFSFVRVENKIKSNAFQTMKLFVSSGTRVNHLVSCAPQVRLFSTTELLLPGAIK
jgi:hypothetical protein